MAGGEDGVFVCWEEVGGKLWVVEEVDGGDLHVGWEDAKVAGKRSRWTGRGSGRLRARGAGAG